MADTREKKDQGYLNRPIPKQPTPGSGIPSAAPTKPNGPLDPADQDGVQGDEGGGDYPGPPNHPSKKKS
jgi:hypothetical protein